MDKLINKIKETLSSKCHQRIIIPFYEKNVANQSVKIYYTLKFMWTSINEKRTKYMSKYRSTSR